VKVLLKVKLQTTPSMRSPRPGRYPGPVNHWNAIEGSDAPP
jgi:hypothetical protein